MAEIREVPQPSNEPIEIVCRFRKVLSRTESGWGVYVYEDMSGMDIVAKGVDLPSARNINIHLYGRWQNYRGRQEFKVSGSSMDEPNGKEEVCSYLKSLRCGLGPAAINRLWTRFGDQVLQILESEPDKAKKLAPQADTEKMGSALKRTRLVRDLMTALGPGNPLNMSQMSKLADHWGDSTVEKIKKNPYSLAFIAGIGFGLTDELAQYMGKDPKQPARVHAAILYALTKQCKLDGNVYMTEDQLRTKVRSLCRKSVGGYCPTDEEIEICKKILLRRKILIYEDGGYYSHRAHAEEHQLAFDISRLMFESEQICDVPTTQIWKYIAEYELAEGIKLAECQKQAVTTAIRAPFSVVTGGAGTGKTTVIKCILWCLTAKLKEKDEKIKLMAPTGRAAKRMSEVTRMTAQTIHRAAGIQVEGAPRIQKVDEDGNKILFLDATTIIIDEASMMDQHVAAELMAQIESGTRVILIGDPGQLPSVGAGNVLFELIKSSTVPVTKLTQIFRQGHDNPIVHNSLMIQKGSMDFIWGKPFQMHETKGVEETLKQAVAFYVRCVRQFSLDDVILLNPYRKGNLTVDMFNREIQKIVNPPKEGETTFCLGGTTFRVGDRVMQTKNQPSGIANGDTGEIVRIYRARDESNEVTTFVDILFDGSVTETYERSQMEHIQLAYCTSVHKSQGGEWKVAIIIASPEHRLLMQRNLLYTAVTRAKEGVAIFGEMSALQYAVSNNVVPDRNTHLGADIRELYYARNAREKQTATS